MARKRGRVPHPKTGLVGQNLRRLRGTKKLSQSALAKLAGVARGTIADLERGWSQSPDARTLAALAGALKVEEPDFWRDPSKAVQDVQEIRQTQELAENLAPGLSSFLVSHAYELAPREIDELKSFSFKLSDGYEPDEKFWTKILSAIRLRLARENS